VFTSPQWLGSDFDFLREFAQASFVVPLRPGAVAWAQGYRLGLIQTMRGQRLPYDDLFKAGGPTSVRGFSLDSLGPTSLLTGEALGGKALVVINQELRFRHQTGLGAALFWDAGNVFAEASDLGFDLRHSLGVGLRYDSIIGLVRFDLAFPIARRPGEARYRFSFGLGQAF
jgi:translocation and assembly module TamA